MVHFRLKIDCQILRRKCTKFDFSWGSTPDPAEVSLQCFPITLSWIKGGLLLREGKGGRGRGKGKEGKGKWRKGRGKEGIKGGRGGVCFKTLRGDRRPCKWYCT